MQPLDYVAFLEFPGLHVESKPKKGRIACGCLKGLRFSASYCLQSPLRTQRRRAFVGYWRGFVLKSPHLR